MIRLYYYYYIIIPFKLRKKHSSWYYTFYVLLFFFYIIILSLYNSQLICDACSLNACFGVFSHSKQILLYILIKLWLKYKYCPKRKKSRNDSITLKRIKIEKKNEQLTNKSKSIKNKLTRRISLQNLKKLYFFNLYWY